MGLLSKEEYFDYCSRFKKVWLFLKSISYPSDEVIYTICELRNYSWELGVMPNELMKIGFVYIDRGKLDLNILRKNDLNGDLGLFTKDGDFLLQGRFIFPVKDMLGNIIALIGWFPDEKKYITTPSKMFSKKCLFFGMEQIGQTGIGKDYFLVEGIFDSISVRSLGYNCVALMGISVSLYTNVLYSLFRRLIAIPDNDSEGRDVILHDKWKIPTNASYLKLKGNLKDIDDVIKNFDMSDTLLDAWNEKDRVIELNF